MKGFDIRLKKVLDSKGISAYKLAKNTGISAASIGRYLNDERLPDGQTLIKMINYLDVDANWLLTGFNEPSKKDVFSNIITSEEENYLNSLGRDKIVAYIISNKEYYLASDEFKDFLELLFTEQSSKVLGEVIVEIVKEKGLFKRRQTN